MLFTVALASAVIKLFNFDFNCLMRNFSVSLLVGDVVLEKFLGFVDRVLCKVICVKCKVI